MKCNFIHIKLKDKSFIDTNKEKKILEFTKLSIENNADELSYNKKISSNQNLEIIYKKKYKKNNIGKIKYKVNKDNKDDNYIQLFNSIFKLNNKKRVKIIAKNKQSKLKKKNYK